MAQYVIGAIEIVVGVYTDNYSLVALGAVTIIGAALTPKPPTVQGPRLNDLKVQASTYGAFIPINYGATRHAGNFIWSTPKLETKHTSGGGKGGSSKPKEETYTYSQSFAVALCEGPIIGIRRIWANGKLIYNIGTTSDIASIVASNQVATGFRVYTGTASQLPDALIQANVGIANCPAYRDTAYVVFENLQLAPFYNQTPNLEFEIVSAGSIIPPSWQMLTTEKYPGRYDAESVVKDGQIVLVGGRSTVDGSLLGDTWASSDGINWTQKSTGQFSGRSGFGLAVLNNVLYMIGGNNSDTEVWASYDNGSSWSRISTGIMQPRSFHTSPVFNGLMWIIGGHSGFGGPYSDVFSSPDGAAWTHVSAGNFPARSQHSGIVFNGLMWIIGGIDITSVHLNDVWSSPDGINWTQKSTGQFTARANHTTVIKDGLMWISGGVAVGVVYLNDVWSSPDGVTWTQRENLRAPQFRHTSQVLNKTIVNMNYTNNASDVDYYTGVAPVATTSPTVGSVVADICSRVGLQSTDIDTSQLTDLCDGYTITSLSTARAALEPLMQAYYFNALESDGKIKFVKRGQSTVVLIPEDDLAAHPYGTQMPDQMKSVRKQEMELPMEVTVQYLDKAADYLVGDQYSRRLTTSSKTVVSIQMAMALSAAKAKQISDVLRYDSWASRTARSFQTANKYSYLEPTDVVQGVKDGKTYTVRIINKDQSAGICKFSAVDEDATIYTQSAVGASLPVPTQIVATVGLTYLYLLDIPLLRDQDNGVGFYAAACGYLSNWTGAQIFKSNDGGASWAAFGSGILNAATMGTATTVLGNFLSGNIFDETNSVTVTLLNGTLSSITELGVLNGGNVALIGSEIIQFKNAVLTAANTYTLTGLLRGRQGTEWAMPAHVIGERFVSLSASNVYIEGALSSEYNLARKYRGITFGSFLSDASDTNFTDTAVAQKPYAPVQLGGGRDASGNITVNWTRRTRITGSWNSFTDVPLGESVESYDVEIWTAGYAVLKRTFSALSSPTTPYTSAQQVTDFGGNQAAIYLRVYQNSATVGRGYKLEGTL